MRRISVVIIDKQSLFRAGVRQALSTKPSIEVVAECNLGSEALEVIEAFTPDVALIDVNPPSLVGVDLALQVSRRVPGVGLVMLTPYPDDDQLFQAIKSGAAAYVTKDVGAEELIDVIQRVSRGEYPINSLVLSRPRVAEKVLRQFQDLSLMGKVMETVGAPLTAREKEILSHIANGMSNKQIAYTLKISEQTIKNHVTSILRKLNANDRTHAVVMAMRHGWISPEDLAGKAEGSWLEAGSPPDE